MAKKGEKLSFADAYSSKAQKRKHARIPVEIQGSFIYKNINTTVTGQCTIISLSTGGLSIRTSTVLLRNDVISITFAIGKNVINEFCKITRMHGKELGCKFTNPLKENIEIIQEFIYGKIFI